MGGHGPASGFHSCTLLRLECSLYCQLYCHRPLSRHPRIPTDGTCSACQPVSGRRNGGAARVYLGAYHIASPPQSSPTHTPTEPMPYPCHHKVQGPAQGLQQYGCEAEGVVMTPLLVHICWFGLWSMMMMFRSWRSFLDPHFPEMLPLDRDPQLQGAPLHRCNTFFFPAPKCTRMHILRTYGVRATRWDLYPRPFPKDFHFLHRQQPVRSDCFLIFNAVAGGTSVLRLGPPALDVGCPCLSTV